MIIYDVKANAEVADDSKNLTNLDPSQLIINDQQPTNQSLSVGLVDNVDASVSNISA